jgi:hypothetical protein
MEENVDIEAIEQDYCTNIEAQKVEMTQSAALNIMADEVVMDQTAVGIVRADKVHMENSFALILNTDEAEGDVKALVSPVGALIAGGAILLAALIWRRR